MRVIRGWTADGQLTHINPLEVEQVVWDKAIVVYLRSGRFINLPRYSNKYLVDNLEVILEEALDAKPEREHGDPAVPVGQGPGDSPG